MIEQEQFVIHETCGDYIVQVDGSGMYSTFFNDAEAGKWIGIAVCKTSSAAHRAIKEHENYISNIVALENEDTGFKMHSIVEFHCKQ